MTIYKNLWPPEYLQLRFREFFPRNYHYLITQEWHVFKEGYLNGLK